MKLSDYLNQQERGGKSAFAKKIGAHASDLSDWINDKRPIPAHFAPAIERESNRAVTRKDCRPNDWEVWWPNFMNQTETQQEA